MLQNVEFLSICVSGRGPELPIGDRFTYRRFLGFSIHRNWTLEEKFSV